ncbi:hypothetical protein TVAG_185770 [Trichomonas vaginalis G3]|uniref:Uncharacterized protein n=2 Tax=Trichomonas vaginalis (strain ATCC PRA-98 / G3) TaxID=412133 RepID=A2D8M1_TRIV3|nr:hypothetical protein TVAG_185770 [Trichomonas vaginalis G3]|eukprot:XP_001584256.1 hypothetical protein [Trichomonas vaginalis G3]
MQFKLEPSDDIKGEQLDDDKELETSFLKEIDIMRSDIDFDTFNNQIIKIQSYISVNPELVKLLTNMDDFELFFENRIIDLIQNGLNSIETIKLFNNIVVQINREIFVQEDFFDLLLSQLFANETEISLKHSILMLISNLVVDNRDIAIGLYNQNLHNEIINFVTSTEGTPYYDQCLIYLSTIFESFYYYDIEDNTIYLNFFQYIIEKHQIHLQGILSFIWSFIKESRFEETDDYSFFKTRNFLIQLNDCLNNIDNLEIILNILIFFIEEDDAQSFFEEMKNINENNPTIAFSMIDSILNVLFNREMKSIDTKWPNSLFIRLITKCINFEDMSGFCLLFTEDMCQYIDYCSQALDFHIKYEIVDLYQTILNIHENNPTIFLHIFKYSHFQQMIELIDGDNSELCQKIINFFFHFTCIAERNNYMFNADPEVVPFLLKNVDEHEYINYVEILELFNTTDFASLMESALELIDDEKYTEFCDIFYQKIENFNNREQTSIPLPDYIFSKPVDLDYFDSVFD